MNIDGIRARLEAATSGPWRSVADERGGYRHEVLTADGDPVASVDRADDAAFIAHAPADIASLLAEVERLTAAVNASDGHASRGWATADSLHQSVKEQRERAEQAEAEVDRKSKQIAVLLGPDWGDTGKTIKAWSDLSQRALTAEAERDSARDSLRVDREASHVVIEGLRAALVKAEMERDHWRAVAEARPEITAKDAAVLVEAWTSNDHHVCQARARIRDAFRAHAAKASVPPSRDCTCLGSCKGAEGLAPGWRCAKSTTEGGS